MSPFLCTSNGAPHSRIRDWDEAACPLKLIGALDGAGMRDISYRSEYSCQKISQINKDT